MIRPKHIILRLLLVAIPMLLAMASAVAQTKNVFVGQSVELSVVEIPGDTYSWELYSDVTGINFAVDEGNCKESEAEFKDDITTGPVVHVTWLSPGTYFFKVTSQRAGCSMNLKVGKVIVENSISTISLSISQSSICIGQSANLEVNFTGVVPTGITYRILSPTGAVQVLTYNNITGNPCLIPFIPTETGIYTLEILSVTDVSGTNSTKLNMVTVTVNPKPASSRIYKYDPVSKKK